MKFSLFTFFLFLFLSAYSQDLQLHYDFRHTLDPKVNAANYPSFYFGYLKDIDTLGNGSILIKLQTDLNGKNNNVGQCFTQVSQSLKWWKPKVFLYLTYSGGVGVTTSAYGFYITNSFGVGVSGVLTLDGTWIVPGVSYRVNTFDKFSYDPQMTLYAGRGLFNNRMYASASFTMWTENRDQGNDYTKDLKGKKLAFFGDPQLWIRVKNKLSIGSKINVYYNLLSENKIQFYPTIGIKYQI
jgi:hypothetical protein